MHKYTEWESDWFWYVKDRCIEQRYWRHIDLCKVWKHSLSIAINFLFHVLTVKLESLRIWVSAHWWFEDQSSDASEEFESHEAVGDDEPGLHESSRLNLESPHCSLWGDLSVVVFNSLAISDWGEGITGAKRSHGSESPDWSEDDPEKTWASDSTSNETTNSWNDWWHLQATKDAEDWDCEAWGDTCPESPYEPLNEQGVNVDSGLIGSKTICWVNNCSVSSICSLNYPTSSWIWVVESVDSQVDHVGNESSEATAWAD